MNIFNLFQNNKPIQKEERRSGKFSAFALSYGGGSTSITEEKALKLSVVYRCVAILSDSVSTLPIDLFRKDSKGNKIKVTNHPLCEILACNPNKKLNIYQFWKLMIQSMLNKGAGYAFIEKEGNNIKGLHWIPTEFVTVRPPQTIADAPTYEIQGINGIVDDSQIIKILNYSADGICGISTLRYAARAIGIASAAEETAESFYEGGANVSGIIKVNAPLDEEQALQIKNSWTSSFGKNGTPQGIAVMEGSMSFEKVSISPEESQLLETRAFDVVNLCRFYGVSPVLVGDLSHSSYSTSEAQSLDFLVRTLAPILRKIECELNHKLLEQFNMVCEFNTNPLLRADKQAQAQYFSTMLNIAAMTPNEVRQEIGLEPVENGDENLIQVNMSTLKKITSEEPITEDVVQEDIDVNKNNEKPNIEQ